VGWGASGASGAWQYGSAVFIQYYCTAISSGEWTGLIAGVGGLVDFKWWGDGFMRDFTGFTGRKGI
jgi:hypothetical protein